MSTNQPTSENLDQPTPPLPGLLARLAQHPILLIRGLLFLVGLLVLLTGTLAFRYGWTAAVVITWAIFLALSCGIAVLYLRRKRRDDSLTPQEHVRMLLLTLGGACGFLTALMGLALALGEDNRKVLTGGPGEWHKKPVGLVLAGLALIAGLVLMFLSLQLGRGLERSRPVVRRTLYGYNVVLSSLLLLLVLAVVNVLGYVQLPPFSVLGKTFDWTHSRKFTIDDNFRKLLGSIKEPIHIYAILGPSNNEYYQENLERLLTNCRLANNKVEYTFFRRDRNLQEVRDLMQKYSIPEPDGVVVVYGDEAGKPTSEYIKRDDLGGQLVQDPRDPEMIRLTRFTGEDAIYKAVDLLSQDKARPVIYFTQGNGELDVTQRMQGGRGESISGLFSRLSDGNYTPRELTYDGKESAGELTQRLLKEAAVVVVARPTRTLPAPLVNALRGYARGDSKKRGKLILLFGVVADQDGKMVKTGMEDLAEEYHVHVNNDRLITPVPIPQIRMPQEVIGIVNERSDNPIANAFLQTIQVTWFRFRDCRSLEIVSGGPQAGGIRAEPLLLVPQNLGVFAATNLNASPEALAEEQRKLGIQEMIKRSRSRPPLVVAATVSEGRPQIPEHAGMQLPDSGKQQPVMVVFGDASWLEDSALQTGKNWSLFSNCLSWLRERPDTGLKIDPKKPEFFTPNVPLDGGRRLLLLPGVLVGLCIVGLGVGVWVVRRR